MSHFRFGLRGMALVLLLGGCGQQGPLYLPNDEPRDIVTRPTQTPPQPPTADDTAEAPNSPQTVDSPVAAPAAPEVTAPETEQKDPEKKDPEKKNEPNGNPPRK